MVDRTNIRMSTGYSVQDLWPDIRTVREIDELLRTRWLLDFKPDAVTIKKQFPEIDDVVRRFEEAEQKAVIKAGPQGIIDERELFRLLAHAGLFAHKAAGRRHLILDGIALTVGLLRLYGLNGPVLDIGCHLGTTADVIARLVPNKVVGIDPVGAAIETARRHSADLTNIEFHRTMVPWETATRFDLVLCLDVLHHVPMLRQAGLIRSIGLLVEERGFVVVSGPSLVDPEWLAIARPALLDARLGYVDCDVFGGFGGDPPSFSATGFAVLRKGEASPLPRDVTGTSAREWENHFQAYANAPGTPAREKTQAFERAARTSQGREDH
jgi:2-polyprenyl-3-methyl-5-hydroxy-6-metoxy-1,4-benzoquinol methylase